MKTRTLSSPPRPTQPDWRPEWERRKGAFVEDTWRRMMRDQSGQRLYGYYTPSAGATWGEFHAVAEGDTAPEGTVLIAAEAIPLGDRREITFWLNRYVQQLPMLPTAGEWAYVRQPRS